jgi:hypothetical protein
VEQLPPGDAARRALVSRLLTKCFYRVTPRYRSCYKNSLGKNILVFKREIHNGLMELCSVKVTRFLKKGKEEREKQQEG